MDDPAVRFALPHGLGENPQCAPHRDRRNERARRQCDLTGAARNRVLLKDRPKVDTRPEQKGILAALINRDGPVIDPDLRSTIDIKVTKALCRAMEQAGIRPWEAKKAGNAFPASFLV